MASAYTILGKNAMLDALGVTHISAHTGVGPGETGANEVTGGSPAYARIPITWNASAAGVIDSIGTQVLDIPAGTTVTFVGFWDSLTGGTCLGYSDIADVVFSNQGTLTVTDADLDLNA